MKKNSLVICSIVIAVVSLFSSCKKENVTLAISLTNKSAKDSVYSGESVTIAGVASTTGKFRMIQFFSSPYNGGGPAVEVTAAEITSCANKSTFNFSAVIPNIKASTKIMVKATDQNGQITTTDFSIKLLESNILTYSNLQLGGWDSDYGSCLDVDAGIPYGSSALSDNTKRPLLDVFFDMSKLANVDLDSIYYNNVSRLHDTGIRYATTTFTSSDFNAMKSDDSFKGLMATLPNVPIKMNDVVFFITKSGKKGLLRVSNLTSPTGDLMLDEKIQK
jgi:hypothetical protein